MTKAVYQFMFVSLSALLMAVLFVIQPTDNVEVKDFQKNIREQFTLATQQVLGEESYTESFALVWAATESFYQESAEQTIALLQPTDSFMNLALSFDKSYQANMTVAKTSRLALVPTEDPIYNIIPTGDPEDLIDPNFNEDVTYFPEYGGMVAGESISVDEEQQEQQLMHPKWSNMTDALTGEVYCVAIFNGEVNTYPGKCAEEEVDSSIIQVH